MAQGRPAVYKRRAKAPKVLQIVLVTEHTLGVTRNYPVKAPFPGSVLNLSTRSRLPTAVHQFYEVAAHLCTQYSDLGA